MVRFLAGSKPNLMLNHFSKVIEIKLSGAQWGTSQHIYFVGYNYSKIHIKEK